MGILTDLSKPHTFTALAASAASLLGGCAGSNPHFRDRDIVPPQESTRMVLPAFYSGKTALSESASAASPINVSDGVTRGEAWGLVCGYALARANLAEQSLKDSIARGSASRDALRDAQLFADLGVVAQRAQSNERSFFDVSGLTVLNRSNEELISSVQESRIVANELSKMMLAQGDAAVRDQARVIQTLGRVLQWDLDLAKQNSDFFSPAQVKERLLVDAMLGDWLRVIAAERFAEFQPRMRELMSSLAPGAAMIMRGDDNLAQGFATFDAVWPKNFTDAEKQTWNAASLAERYALFVLFRTVPAQAYPGTGGVEPVAPSAEIQAFLHPTAPKQK